MSQSQPLPAVTKRRRRSDETLTDLWNKLKSDPRHAELIAAKIQYEATLNGEVGAAAKRLLARMSGEHDAAE